MAKFHANLTPQVIERNIYQDEAEELSLEIEKEIQEVITKHGWPSFSCPLLRFDPEPQPGGASYNYKTGDYGFPVVPIHLNLSGVSCLRMEFIQGEQERRNIVADVLGRLCYHIHHICFSKFLE